MLSAFSGLSVAQTTKAQLEVSETLFSMAAALNSCGYDVGLQDSLPLRQTVRSEVIAILRNSPQAAQAGQNICQFWQEHQLPSNPDDSTQYVSLALELGAPPTFAPTVPEADLPPDAARVLGVISPLQKFYQAASLHTLWQKHQNEYESLIAQFHDPLAEVIVQTDLYLKLPYSNYPGQRFVVYLEPLLAPSQVHARNYGTNYFVVVAPGRDGLIRLPEIRHTYLHYVLEPMALGHAQSLRRLEPILDDLAAAPMSRIYHRDISLLVNESLIRAIEARLAIPESNEANRRAYVERSVAEGFIFTHYFYEALAQFEKESANMRNRYGDLLYNIDLDRERKRARNTQFAAVAAPEVLSARTEAKNSGSQHLLDDAEAKLAAGDAAGARQLAGEVVRHNNGGDEPGRAAFIMARAAVLSGNMQEAQWDFQQAVQSLQDPRLLAWSHIYLGRIYDIQDRRDEAVAQYRAALAAGDVRPDTKAAAEKGLASRYEAPRKSQ